MFLGLHFVLNLLTFALEKFVKMGTVRLLRLIMKPLSTAELPSVHEMFAQTVVQRCFRLILQRIPALLRNSVIVYFLVEFDTCRCCKERRSFTHLRVSYLRPSSMVLS